MKNLSKNEVLTRLCRLVCQVGAEIDPVIPRDCFCQSDNVLVGEEIIEFIENAVKEKLKEKSK